MFGDLDNFYGISTHLFYGLWGAEAKIKSLEETRHFSQQFD